VESGLDIPNANTIIINRAQNFGLAELYQLRGRVGRSNQQAFCYLLIPPVKTISTNTLRRLQAIEEFTDLGSGFQLAMRDMEIRGAGNLLGAEQSGTIIDIGFELFNKILDEAVAELREEEFASLFEGTIARKPKMFKNEDLVIDLDTDALIPPEYVQSDTDRFYFYKKMYNATQFDELSKVIDELSDKYGKYPPNVKNLIFAVKLRIAALDTGFVKLTLKHSYLVMEFPQSENKEFYEKALPVIMDYIQQDERCLLKQGTDKLELCVHLARRDEAVEYVWRMKNLMIAEFSE
jgi:transcription-repair coupling factor (superfamily II helicase)